MLALKNKLTAEIFGTFWLVIGGIAGAAVLYFIASGKTGFSTAGGFASNGFGEHSPGGNISNFLPSLINHAKQ